MFGYSSLCGRQLSSVMHNLGGAIYLVYIMEDVHVTKQSFYHLHARSKVGLSTLAVTYPRSRLGRNKPKFKSAMKQLDTDTPCLETHPDSFC